MQMKLEWLSFYVAGVFFLASGGVHLGVHGVAFAFKGYRGPISDFWALYVSATWGPYMFGAGLLLVLAGEFFRRLERRKAPGAGSVAAAGGENGEGKNEEEEKNRKNTGVRR